MAPQPLQSLGAYLRQRRKRLGFTQAEVALAVGLSSAQVSRIESDITTSLSADTAKGFATKLRVRPVYLWSSERSAGDDVLGGSVATRLLGLPVGATCVEATAIVFSEVRQAHPWIEGMSIAVATDPNVQNGMIRWYHAPEVTEESTLVGRETDLVTAIEDGVIASDDPTPVSCQSEHRAEAKEEILEYLQLWKAGTTFSRFDLRSWMQVDKPVTCVSVPYKQVCIDYQILGHLSFPTQEVALGAAKALARYLSLTDSTRTQGTQRSSDIEARLSRIEEMLEQITGDSGVSSVA